MIGRYEISDELGSSSFATVYLCRDTEEDRDVAIKVCSATDEGLLKRFEAEAQIAAQLDHPNIVRVFGSGVCEDGPYLVQEYLEGEDLADIIARRDPLPLGERLALLVQIARGLNYAHSQGVVHRDVCPSNMRVLPDGNLKLVDFGLARLAQSDVRLTKAGSILGTAGYLPPEEVLGRSTDERGDLFSFGAVAYHLLTYERPFPGEDLKTFLRQVLQHEPPPLSENLPDCPPELEQLVAGCMEKEPEQRFKDLNCVLADLVAVAEGLKTREEEEPVESEPEAEAAEQEPDRKKQTVTLPLGAGPNSALSRAARVVRQAIRNVGERSGLAWEQLRWPAIGAMAMAFVALGWWALGRQTRAEGVPEIIRSSKSQTPVALQAPPLVRQGQAQLIAAPWGEVLAVERRATSDRVHLPGDRITPLSVSLPLGHYRAVLANPYAPEARICYFEVTEELPAVCRVRFFDQSAGDHFAEAGWWR